MAAALLIGCAEGGPTSDEAPERVRREPTRAIGVRAARLLPVERGRATWYRAHRYFPDAPKETWDVVFFPVPDPDAGLCLESIGLGGAVGDVLRLVAYDDRLWLVSTADGRAWEGHRLYDSRTGGGTPARIRLTTGREAEAVRFEQGLGGVTLRTWFVAGVGLERLELREGAARRFLLERRESVSLAKPAGGYARDTPQTFWRSFQAALRRLDADALQDLVGGELARRLTKPLPAPRPLTAAANAAMPGHDRDGAAVRIRAIVADFLAARVVAAGPWTVDAGVSPPVARCPAKVTARVDGVLRTTPATIVLEQRAAGWTWIELERPPS